MARHARLVRPDVVVVTSIGSEHNTSLGTLEGIREEKAEMVRSLPATALAVLNADDPNVMWMASQTRARVTTFGFDERADITVSDYQLDWPRGSHLTVRTKRWTRELRVRLLGRQFAYAVAATVAVAEAEGVPLDDAIARLETMPPGPRCLEPVMLPNGAAILRDDYKSTMETVDRAFDLAAEVPARRRILILGPVPEAIDPRRMYRGLGERSAKIFSQAILLIGETYTTFRSGAREQGLARDKVSYVRTLAEAVALLPRDLGEGDLVLIKGPATRRMERLMLMLQGRQVRCELVYCDAKLIQCDSCAMLEPGWPEGRRAKLIVRARD
jgi:UDP-N-acetylmuramyl pentapeptide synthase